MKFNINKMVLEVLVKKIFKGLVLSLLVGVSLVVQAAPVCEEAAIATYKQEIAQRERVNMFVRSAVYVCAASVVAYGAYKFFHPGVSPEAIVIADHTKKLAEHTKQLAEQEKCLDLVVDILLEKPEKATTVAADASKTVSNVEIIKAAGAEIAKTAVAEVGTNVSTEASKIVAVESAKAAVAKAPVARGSIKGAFFSGTWIAGFCVGVRDMLFQSAAVAGLLKIAERVGQYAFYDSSLHSFLVRGTSLGRIVGDIDGYAGMLTTPGYGEAQLIPIKDLLKTRCADLCNDVERMVAYMRYLEDSVGSTSKGTLVVAENFLVNRSNSALASLLSLISKDKPEEIAGGIALTLHLFQADVQQACTRFDSAYRAAQA